MSRLLLLVPFALVACSEKSPETPAAARTSGTKIQLKAPDDTLLCKLKPRDDGFRIYDGKDVVLGEIRVQSDRVKLKDARDVEVWKIKKKDYGAEIEDGAGKRLYRIRLKDGDWRLEEADDKVLAKAKPKPDGFELRDAEGKTIAKAKKRDGKVALETEAGERINDVSGTEKPLAAMWFALERFSLAERAALCAYFDRVHR